MKSFGSIFIRAVVACIVAFLIAGAGTKITYDCEPSPQSEGCVSFEKAVMHPKDLSSNYQNSLVRFVALFAAALAITFLVASLVSMRIKRQ
jgi:hypothetical protein